MGEGEMATRGSRVTKVVAPATADRIVAADTGVAPASPEAQRFAELSAEVERRRAALVHWRARRAAFEQAYARSVAPLWRNLQAARLHAVQALERQLDAPGWNRAEQAALRDLLHDRGDAPGRDAEADSDEAELERRGAQREADAKARREARRAQRAAVAHAVANLAADPGVEPAGATLRDVFRRLASALHPDRETDPARRGAKTALMQQANRAHADNDLPALLELQGRIGAGTIPDARRLDHYNRLLAAQAVQLAAQVDRLEAEFRSEIGLPAGRGLNPDRLLGYARQDARQLRELLAAALVEVRLFGDVEALREWLRNARRHRRGVDRDR